MRDSIAHRIALAAMACVLTYGTLEVACMATGVLEPAERSERRTYFSKLFRPDDRYGYRVRENLKGLRVSWLSDEVSMTVDTDSKGFRNPGLDYDKARIFVIGDSFTFGSWVPRDKTFYGELGRLLGEPVLSLGVGGYGMVEYGLLAEDYIPNKPTVAMIGVFANDLTLVPESFSDKHRSKPSGYYFGPVGVWQRYLDPPTLWEISLAKQLSQAVSELVAPAGQAATAAASGQAAAPDGTVLYRRRGAEATYLSGGHAAEIERRLADLLRALKARGAAPLLVLFPSKEVVYQEHYLAAFPDSADYLEVEREGYRRLAEIARSMGVGVVDLAPAMHAARGKTEALYFKRDNHWSAAGHRVAADAIAPAVKELLSKI